MSWHRHAQVTAALALLAGLAGPAAALAAPDAERFTGEAERSAGAARSKTITVRGKVKGGKGYTVVGLAQNGTSVSRKLPRSGRFRLRFRPRRRGRGATLHMIDRRGSYYGPVVLRRRSRRAFVSLSGRRSVNLGTILLSRGWAWVRGRVASSALNTKQTARASKRGKPIGAGKFGRVKARASGATGKGRDPDRDGIPGAFDVDDDGNLVLDNFERAGRRRSARAAQDGPPPPGGSTDDYHVFSNFKVDIRETLNANAGPVSRRQVDQLLSSRLGLAMGILRGDSSELDCNGLPYCSKGGTGRAGGAGPGDPAGRPFPDAFDGDGDGHGTMLPSGPAKDFQLFTGATSSQIGAGDSFIQLVRRDGTETAYPEILNYVFWTTPAVTSIGDGTTTTAISYPANVGTRDNPIAVTGSPDVVLTITFWRPQRQAIAGEGSRPIDIGRMRYTVDPGVDAPGEPVIGECVQPADYSTSDPNLSVVPFGGGVIGGVRDSSDDAATDPSRTLTFSINLTRCLARKGGSWDPGELLRMDVAARSEFNDNAAQGFYLIRR